MIRSLLAPLGGLPYRDPLGKWRTSRSDGPGDSNGPLQDAYRVAAAAYLYRDDPQMVLAIGDPSNPETGMPSGACVVEQELVELGGVARSDIARIETKSTHRQLIQIGENLRRLSITKVIVISNDWHNNRVTAMIRMSEHLQILRRLDCRVVSAEAILLEHDFDRWSDDIRRSREDNRMAPRIRSEQEGEMQIYSRRYRFQT
jgi:hypothetical protein